MRITRTDVVALGVIGLSAAAAVATTVTLRSVGHEADHANVRHFEAGQVDRLDREGEERDGLHRHHDGREGATIVRIRGDAAVDGQAQLRVRKFDDGGQSVRVDASIEPLIYIDGVRIADGMPDDLAPDDIERIEVVKGGAALELFGEDAEGGVIQIFLKRTAAENPGR